MIPFLHIPSYAVARWKLRDYRAKKVSFGELRSWAKQFPSRYRPDLIRLAGNLEFVSEEETIDWLVALNDQILDALGEDDVSIKNVIYVTTDTAGSSSGVMLNHLRDRANLERRGAQFLDSRDVNGIQEATRKLGSGAIVYVDDFAGTGKQFTRSRRGVAEYIIGAFSEFFLLPCICEEALLKVTGIGVEPLARIVHMRSERPLLEECRFLKPGRRKRLVELSGEHWGISKVSLGFGGLATNVIFYRNAPNTTPLIFRGSLGQKPFHGIVPRFDDL